MASLQLGWSGLALSVFGIIVLSFIIIHQAFRNQKKCQSCDCPSSIQPVSFLVYAIYFGFVVSLLILSCLELSGNITTSVCENSWLWVNSWLLPGKIFLYVYFVIRLHEIFKTSVFGYPVLRLKAFGVISSLLLFVFGILFIVAKEDLIAHIAENKQAINSLKECDDVMKTHIDKSIFFVAVTGFTLIDLILSILLLRLYLAKLLFLSTLYDKAKNNQDDQSNTEIDHEETDFFLYQSIKATNLFLLAMITSYFSIIISASNVGVQWNIIEAICNSLAIYLSFNSAENIYKKIYGHCDQCWFRVFFKFCFVCCCLRKGSSDEIGLVQNAPAHNTQTEEATHIQHKEEDE